ncbi:PepSY domain-containing protein [Pseudoalteromonas fenneropenaei]|uniref:PepSY domain-containing protein n=1 Tax=Pseudoalteromonas fenneropenaei TaxID=1737459 RepID=A0ABV7CQ46_9GAMM
MKYLLMLAVAASLFITSPMALGFTDDAITKKQAVELALKEYKGRTLKISDHNDYYVVRILQDDGRVIDVQVDKKTGEVRKD